MGVPPHFGNRRPRQGRAAEFRWKCELILAAGQRCLRDSHLAEPPDGVPKMGDIDDREKHSDKVDQRSDHSDNPTALPMRNRIDGHSRQQGEYDEEAQPVSPHDGSNYEVPPRLAQERLGVTESCLFECGLTVVNESSQGRSEARYFFSARISSELDGSCW